MRPLRNEEARIFFEKLNQFIGNNAELLLKRDGQDWTFRVHKDRVYYLRKQLADLCPPFQSKLLLSAGICMGKFTHKGRFFLHVTSLSVIAPIAQAKVWIKPSAEIGFLYGQHILAEGVQNIDEGVKRNDGVVVYNANNLPIGLGVALQSSVALRKALPTIHAVARIGDLGEYLRDESTIT
ncbi:60S ribosome subunit biogenesis protein NIP7 [Histomonas meleagridis]|uniref:60S ribosome subunit biogenesis protein NIP7-like n=1 Tax=Histomonas meleagridis TaxID=135588 RepID=UPI003559F224|nr:60S ribosome subunit biogenesis protein NIP7 [Histomonas meleagridis]KAH0797243.1 60S ribosome subunit biogenesis protein NIP7-like [Histomonas meleagridis]